MKRERFDYADWVPLVALIVFLLFLAFGCGARKPYAGPKWQGPWPKGVACGERTKMDDGSEWIFPCFPEKNIPRCVKGCKLIAIVLGKPQLWRRFWS